MSRDPLVRHAGRLRNLEQHLQFSPVMVTYAGNPDGLLTAREGTFCWDTTNHNLYINVSDMEGTDWNRVGHGWERVAADSVTLIAGTTASALADLQTARDGNFYAIQEAAATPGINFIVDFVDVVSLEFVEVDATYNGSTTDAVAIQLYNWVGATWDTFDALQTGMFDVTTANGYIIGNHTFNVFEDDNYIGVGANDGEVRVRFYHTMGGNASHNLYIDEVAIYY